MTPTELETAREVWLKEKKDYRVFILKLKNELDVVFGKAKIPIKLSCRVKDDDSLLKKMMLKGKAYSEITDKAGARAVVHFASDMKYADNLIIEHLGKRIIKRENKIDTCDENTFGYLSIHYDIINSISDDEPMVCELQLRTVCQNAWSELSHILTYKPGVQMPKEIKREVNSLSALMEIADNQFQKIHNMISLLPASNPIRILNALSGFFYSNVAAWYDTEMSYYFLDEVDKLYNAKDDIIAILEQFINDKGECISELAQYPNRILFFSQPEIVVILERLDNRKLLLEDYWKDRYPLSQLEEIANVWGTTLN